MSRERKGVDEEELPTVICNNVYSRWIPNITNDTANTFSRALHTLPECLKKSGGDEFRLSYNHSAASEIKPLGDKNY